VEFSDPVSAQLRSRLVEHACKLNLDFLGGGVYGATQGPRLETAAEIDRLARDGCTLVGMTAMPEAGLARELDLDYAICAVVVNWAAGRSSLVGGIHAEIDQYLDQGMAQAKKLLKSLIYPD
jgi:5'-methylthioinosine phosphorylase